MAKLVILKFNGNFESGFQVNLEIGQEGKSFDRGGIGYLPPAPELNQCLRQWQKHYNQLGNNYRIKPQQIIYDGFPLYPKQQLARWTQKLQYELQIWLNCSSFNDLDKCLREELNRQEAIRLLICSDRPQLYQLPWCCWDLVDNYPRLEIAVSNFNFARVSIAAKISRHQKVRILAILGDGQGINLEVDRSFLASLNEGEVVFLTQPTPQELYTRLWQESWDIIFFAGHSKTIARQGILSLNAEDQLTIKQLKHGFKQAIALGLKLAIFNSCDGLGLAEELGQLSLPQSIVMRMPIPDIMAQQFVKYFLQAYAGGNSLYLASRMAREQLQAWEKQFPCASWLPTIYQNPAIIPPDWSDLRSNHSLRLPFKKTNSHQRFTATLLIGVIVAIVVWLIQSWGWLETAELKTYDRFLTWRMTPPTDQRVLVVTIDDNDIKYQREQGMTMNMEGSLADRALNQLLLKLKLGQVEAIASDIIHDFPFDPKLAATIAQTDNFFAICRIEINQRQLESIAPPPQLPTQQIGFSNWVIDNDGTIRRQLLGMSHDDVCQSDLSLGLRLALYYLEDPPAKFNQQGLLQIGDMVFPKLNATSGGYHLPEAQGYQILLNYRRALPRTIPLREILTMSESSLKELVNQKILLIGVWGHNLDLHHTPYSHGQDTKRLPGVIVHAQMTTHIISLVLGEQKLLWWLSDQIELLWITIWSIIGSLIVVVWRRSFSKVALGILAFLTLIFSLSWLLLLNSGWLVAIAPALGLLLAATITSVYLEERHG
jgi:CHASE2 domain-containing sensor protein